MGFRHFVAKGSSHENIAHIFCFTIFVTANARADDEPLKITVTKYFDRGAHCDFARYRR